LRLQFNDGASGEANLQDLIFKYPAAEPLRDKACFQKFSLDEWSTVVWDCGFDVSPETLYERVTDKTVAWLNATPKLVTDFAGKLADSPNFNGDPLTLQQQMRS
jgi:Protein of unknown function (DUF2442).